MKKFLVNETEKNKILKLHGFLQEQAQTPQTDEEKLQNAINQGCIAKYSWFIPDAKPIRKTKSGKPIVYGKGSNGNVYYFYADMTIVNATTGAKKTWVCTPPPKIEPTPQQQDDERLIKKYRDQGWKTIEDLRVANEDTRPSELQKKFETMQIGNTTLYKEKIIGQEQKYDTQKIKDYIVGLGYIVDPDDITLAQGGLTPYSLKDKLGIDPTKYGLPADYKIYKEPSGQNVQSRINPVRQDIERQEIRRKDCKEVIDTFYDFYKLDPRGARTVDEKTSSLKPDVQSCVYQHYPTKLFGRNFNRKVEELAGLSSFTPQGKKYKIELP